MIKLYILDIIRWLRENNFKIDPLPEIILRKSKQDQEVFIRTGKYDRANNRLVIYTDGRHVKDILRSFLHEITHHNQYLTNPEEFMRIEKLGAGKALEHSPELEELEADAYLRGNLLFRRYTEQYRV